jgi:hypothetical protein
MKNFWLDRKKEKQEENEIKVPSPKRALLKAINSYLKGKKKIKSVVKDEIVEPTVIHFSPEQITHMEIGTEHKAFQCSVTVECPKSANEFVDLSSTSSKGGRYKEYERLLGEIPSISIEEKGDRRVFYIDVEKLPPEKAEAFIERLKANFKGQRER